MTTVLIDPTLRRARFVRASFVVLSALVLSTLVMFARGLVPETRSPLPLPSPRRAATPERGRRPRPESGQRRPGFGQRRTPGHPDVALHNHSPDGALKDQSIAGEAPLSVTAYLDPSARGALASLDRHADLIDTVAAVGLLLGDGGEVIDRVDEAGLDVARSHALPIELLVQNVDEGSGEWRGDRVVRLARDRRARARFADRLAAVCAARSLSGIQLDLEELDEHWDAILPVAAAVTARLRPIGCTVSVDVPAFAERRLLARLAPLVDRVVVMAYDESDEDAPPGPIASDGWVDDGLEAATFAVPPEQLVAGLGIYGYDWIGRDPADPLSFVDAHIAAKEAHAEVRFDRASGNTHLQFSDDEGAHDVWLLDGASVWNQVGVARRRGIRKVALWRLGGEDPGVWDALAARRGRGSVQALSEVPGDDRVDNLGDGPFLSLALAPEAGRRSLSFDGAGDEARIIDERWDKLPSPFLVRRAGIVAGKVALTFDDGPHPVFTPQILDVLKAKKVPASFFVVGMNAAQAPSLVRRAFAEGHEIGNHTFTHPDVDETPTPRLRLELEATSRLVETLIGRRPLLYRPPSLKDIEPRTPEGAAAFARAGALGYLVVDADVDPRDWAVPEASELAQRVLADAGDGGVILLHDGGGDRSATVAALPMIIDGLRARGLSIVPLAELVGKTRDEVMPLAPPRPAAASAADRAVLSGGSVLLPWCGRILRVALVAVALRALLIFAFALLAERRRRKRATSTWARTDGDPPVATVVIPAYNEAEVIERTVASVLASDVPVRVIVIDDGSTDGTGARVLTTFGADPRVSVVMRKNGGKSAALRAGFALARTEIVVALDGDTLFLPDTVRRLVEPFADRCVGAVAGTCEVGNRRNLLTACQALEYLVQQEVDRRAWDLFAALPVVPGAIGAWRRRAVAEVGGFRTDTLAEDADLSMALCRAGWRVVHAPSARARTEAPETTTALIKQRVRWSFGMLQAMWKHKGALVERRAGSFGRVVLPAMILFQVILPLLTPAALLSAAVAVYAGNLAPALIAAVVLAACEAVHAFTAAALARRSGAREAVPIAVAFVLARLLYRPLLFVILCRSLGRVLDGIPLGWNKLARRGSVTA